MYYEVHFVYSLSGMVYTLMSNFLIEVRNVNKLNTGGKQKFNT